MGKLVFDLFFIYLKNGKMLKEQMNKEHTQICVLTHTFEYYNVVF